ncbi:MAG: flagellar motor protein MotA [Alphaproteobacteria bacterium]|nr:flagellar motor protein MotA [Alphaproteobacteria bacterium]
MSLPTIFGFLASLVLFAWAIASSTDHYSIFWDIPSIIIVLGGTMAAAFISYEARYVFLALKLIGRIIVSPRIGRTLLQAEVGRIIKWAYVTQKSGLPGLEAEAAKAVKSDRLLRFGIDLVVSGYTGQEVREIMTNMVETTFGRNTVQVAILKALGGASPAFGMVGTLVGLVVMLDNMQDPSALGPALAIALLTTLYGILLARWVFVPAASKILQREEIIRFRNYLVVEGLALLADRKSPRYIQDKMNSYLDPSIHFNIDKMKK